MEENMRLAFSVMWVVAFFCFILSGILFVVTWGDYLPFFAWSLGGLIIATAGAIISSLS